MLTDLEIEKVKGYQHARIPEIYKFDHTANILFVEDVDFDLCTALLQKMKVKTDLFRTKKKVDREFVLNVIKEYSLYLSEVNIDEFDSYAMEHFKVLNEIVALFFRECTV